MPGTHNKSVNYLTSLMGILRGSLTFWVNFSKLPAATAPSLGWLSLLWAQLESYMSSTCTPRGCLLCPFHVDERATCLSLAISKNHHNWFFKLAFQGYDGPGELNLHYLLQIPEEREKLHFFFAFKSFVSSFRTCIQGHF